MEGNLLFEINWASLIVGRKFTIFALHLRAISKYKPLGAYIWRGDLTEGFLRYEFGGLYLEGLIHGGTYFQNFTVYFKPYILGQFLVFLFSVT